MTGQPGNGLDKERIRRLDQTLTAIQARVVSGLPGGEVHRIGPALLTGCSVALRSLNGVFRYDATSFTSVHDERELDACLAVMSTYEVPWRFNTWAHLGGSVLSEQLTRRGMVRTGEAVAVWRDLPRPALLPSPAARTPPLAARTPPLPDGREVRQTRTPQDCTDWARTFLDVYALPAHLEEVFAGMAARLAGACLTGYLGGEPAGTLTCAVAGDVAALCNIGVREEHRGRGLGRQLVEAGQALAASQGATATVILARLPDSGLCRSLGYVEVTRVGHLVPAAVPTGSAQGVRMDVRRPA